MPLLIPLTIHSCIGVIHMILRAPYAPPTTHVTDVVLKAAPVGIKSGDTYKRCQTKEMLETLVNE